MPSPYKYYTFPFGISADDLTTIPDTPPIDNSVNYQTGWTDPYELNLLTDPAAIPIPRGQMNQLFYDITNNIQQYQQYGSPIWVSGISYPIYARVYYSGVVYESQTATNTNTPGTDATWLVISGDILGVPPGTVIDFAGVAAPSGYLVCDGSAVSRTTYAALKSAISFQESGTLTNSANTVSGLTNATTRMYVGMAIEGTNIPSNTTIASIVDANNITMSNTATGSGASTITFFNWGNGNGTTTFNVPDQRRSTKIGSGGSGTAVIGSVTGQSGGSETHTLTRAELPDPVTDSAQNVTVGDAGAPFGVIQSSGTHGSGVVSNNGGGQAHSIMQLANVYTQCIKT